MDSDAHVGSDFNVARAIGGVYATDFGTTAKRQANGRLFRRDLVVWQTLLFLMCALDQQMSSAGGDTGRYG